MKLRHHYGSMIMSYLTWSNFLVTIEEPKAYKIVSSPLLDIDLGL